MIQNTTAIISGITSRIINLQIGKTREEYKIDDHSFMRKAKEALDCITFNTITTVTNIKVILVKVEELGFTENTTFGQIIEAASQRDLDICPAEIAVALWEQYPISERDSIITVAMEPVNGNYLEVMRDIKGENSLFPLLGNPKVDLKPTAIIAFVKNK